MKTNTDQAIEIAVRTKENSKIVKVVETTRLAGEVFEANSSHWHRPFAEQDIRSIQIGEWVSSHDQSAQDKSLVAKFFTESWHTLHVEIATRNCIPSSQETLHVVAVFHALERLGQPHLLTEGLPQHAAEWLNEASTSSKER